MKRPVHVRFGGRSAWLTGPGVVRAADAVGSPRMRPVNRADGDWTIPIQYVHDVIAHLEGVQRRRVYVDTRNAA